MITDTLLTMFFYVIKGLITPLTFVPDVTLNTNIASSIETAGHYYKAVNGFLPVDTMITILGISLTIELAYLTYKIIMWAIKKIPSIN